MRRRAFLLSAAAASMARPSLAQQARVPVVGFMNSGSPEPFERLRKAFLAGLQEAGVTPDTDAEINYQWANGDYDRLRTLASELAARNVSAIAATGGEVSALAAKAATSSIPIVFITGVDPVERGLVESVSRPESNVTGIVQFTFALDAKRFGLLCELVPSAETVAVLLNPARPSFEGKRRELEDAAARSQRRLLSMEARRDEDFEQAFGLLAPQGAGALLVASDPFFFDRRHKLVALAAAHRIPAMYEWRDFPELGGLISYGTNLADGYRQVGLYVGRILKGAKPADLPVVQSTTFELVINLRAARTLGVTVPLTLLAQADEVIE